MIKKGDLVEYTDEWHRDYPPPDRSVIKYGVATVDARDDDPVYVQRGNGVVEQAKHVHASGWAGWCPPELETLLGGDDAEDFEEDC